MGTVGVYYTMLAAAKRKKGIARHREHQAAAARGEFETSTANQTEDWGEKRGPAQYTPEVEMLRLAFKAAKRATGKSWGEAGR